MVLSLLVASPEKDLEAWFQLPEIDGSKDTSLQLSGLVSIWKLGSCQKGGSSQGSLWCSAAQTLLVEELRCQECKLKYLFSTTALR